MRSLSWILIASVVVLAAGCRKAQPKFLHPATIKDIMDSMVAPSGDFVFGAVETVSDEHGVREVAPQNTTFTEDTAGMDPAYNQDNWQALRLRLIVLLEAPNLLVMPGRKVAPPDVTSQNPQIELQPDQIQTLIDGDRAAFVRRARDLQDAAEVALKAVDEKNTDALFQAEANLDNACEDCHLHYWYPNDKRAQQLYEQEQQEEKQQRGNP
ncbi:MAG: hypothetical protein KGL02_12560 [Acidobacteriota bacterium]|nr:hypothetical protein [Acidobacteriota bacterium]